MAALVEPNRASRVAATAARLRLAQADFADADPSERHAAVSDELQRALAEVAPSERQQFLRELTGQFPTWDAEVPLQAPTAATAPADQRDLQDINFLTARLCEIASKLDAKAKADLLTRLRDGGAIGTAVTTWPEEQVAALRTKLQLGEHRGVDPVRVLELAAMLAEFAVAMHQLTVSAWRTLSPDSGTRLVAGRLAATMGKFVNQDPATGRQQVASELDRLRQLSAALIGAIGETSRQATAYTARFAPAQVRQAAGEGGVFSSGEAKCWRKYVEMWDMVDEATIDRDIRLAIAEFAESLLSGVNR